MVAYTHQGNGEVRIIGGQWRRTKLPVALRSNLRPTPDRVRETLFNWLGQDLTGWRCADVFAGTGILGFEAASRGASHVIMVEQDVVLLKHIQAFSNRMQASMVQVQRGDGLTFLQQLPACSTDLIFLDPPFDSNLFLPALKAAIPALTPQGYIYLESAQNWQDQALQAMGIRLHRHLKAGAVHAHLLCA